MKNSRPIEKTSGNSLGEGLLFPSILSFPWGCSNLCEHESQYAKASHNGIAFEKYAAAHIKGFEFVGGLYDALYKGKPLDVKSCQEITSDVYNPGGNRSGRIFFRRDQHKAIVEGGGYYFIVVHAGRKVIKERLVKAELITLPKSKKSISALSWKTVFNMVEAC